MKFTVNLYPYYQFPDIQSLVHYVQEAEALGFDEVGIPEHPAFPQEYERSMGKLWYDSMALASYLAAATKTIKLAFSILILPQHNPLWLAKQLATLDQASGGRAVLGVGVGWLEGEFRALGVDFHKRGAITNDYIGALKALWGPDPCTYRGRHCSFERLVSSPKPVQRPHLPIVIGGSIKTSVPRAAMLGDGWSPMGGTLPEFEAGLAELKGLLKQRGRSLEGFAVHWGVQLYARSAEAEAHVRAAGGGISTSLNGDYDKALEEVRHLKQIGVTHSRGGITHMPFDRMLKELRTFSQRIIVRV